MDGSKPRVLFVDDDSNLLTGLKRTLRSRAAQWSLEFVEHGEEALQRHRSRPYQVVVTDMLMPGMSGLELVQALNQSPSPPACIVLTGMSDLHAASQLINTCDVFRFYTKPCARDELVEGIQAALEVSMVETQEKPVGKAEPVPAAILEREVLDSLSRGVVVVDDNFRPIYMNQPATAFVAQSRGLSVDTQGVLRAGNRPDTHRLHEVLAAVMADDAEMQALTLTSDPLRTPLMLVAARTTTEFDSSHNYAMLFLSGCGAVRSSAPSPDMIAVMLGVTYTEARLIEKLSMGQNLEHAAEEMGVTLSSARTYLKRVQKKTGTSRQVDLIRMVFDIPLP